MNIGLTACMMMAIFFGSLAMIFALLKEKGALLISGFNDLPQLEREKYNQLQMSKDMRNTLLLWSSIFLCGAFVCMLFSEYFAIATFIVWLILFFKEVHWDSENAFSKYRQ